MLKRVCPVDGTQRLVGSIDRALRFVVARPPEYRLEKEY